MVCLAHRDSAKRAWRRMRAAFMTSVEEDESGIYDKCGGG